MFSVSVVIPAHNEALRIGRAIRSVLCQTQPVNEIIVVDDGSTDDTSGIAASFGNPVICIRQNNHGPAAARNTGIYHAKYEWIAFLDADDEWLPGHIESAWKIIGRHPELFWCCSALERRAEEGYLLYRSTVDNSLMQDGIIENYFVAEAGRSFASCSSSMLVKKCVFDEVGVFSEEIRQYGEDLDMWFRIALRYPRIGYTNSIGAIYRMRKGSLTSVYETNIPRFLERIEITRSSSNSMPKEIVKQSELLIKKWIIDAVKSAIWQKDSDSLSLIGKKYSNLLPTKWQAATKILQNSVAMDFASIAIRIRKKVRKFVHK